MLMEISKYQPDTSLIHKFFRLLLGVALIFAGYNHLIVSRQEFLAQVPNWVPLNGDLVVVLSGIAEITLGVMLVAIPKYRAIIGWMVAIFFIAIFPGNISQYTNRIDAFGLDTDRLRFIRLFFQPVFVVWALWSTGAWEASRNRNHTQTD